MKKAVLLLSGIGLIAGCGTADYADVVGGFQSAIIYITDINPNPLESDIITRNTRTEAVYTNAPGCADITAADVCTGVTLFPDSVTVSFAWEPRKDYQNNQLVQVPSPITIQSATLTFERLTAGCPELGSRTVSLGITLSENNATAQTSLDVVPQDIKDRVLSDYGDWTTYTYIDNTGCVTSFAVRVFNMICNYRVRVSFHAVELYTGERDDIRAELSLRLSDFQTDRDGCGI